MNYNFIFGNDNGNSTQKFVIDDKLVISPNINAEIYDIPEEESKDLNYIINNIHENLIVTCSCIKGMNRILGTFMIGDRARRSRYACNSIAVGSTNSKVNSDLIIINTDAHVAAHTVQKHYKLTNELPEELQVTIDMASSLPVKQYGIKSKREFAKRFTDDFDHEIIVHIKEHSVKVKINYEFVLVVPESVPVTHALKHYDHNTWAMYMNRDPETLKSLFAELEQLYSTDKAAYIVSPRTFEDADMLHTAPGEGTCENPLTRGLWFDSDFIEGSNNGIGIAMKNALPGLKKELKLDKLSRQEYSLMIMDSDHRYHSVAMKHLRIHLKPEADEIIDNTITELEKANNNVDFLIAHGGGSIQLRHLIEKPLLNHVNSLGVKLFYVPEEYAVILEALGLYELCKSDLYSDLKQRYFETQQTALESDQAV